MSDESQTLQLANIGYAFDHPEAVAWGPDGYAYAGGEAGQLYRYKLDGSIIEEVARVAGGFLLGLAHDAAGNTYACDDRSACVHRITPDGAVSTYANGNEQQKMRVPNYPVFDDHGNLYVSDSGSWGAKDGFVWKVAPGGKAEIWDRQANGFSNGMCLSADGKWLYVVESCPPLISRVEIRDDGSAGRREVVVELPRNVPDGVAFDAAGDLYISLYNPNIIYRFTTKGELVTLYDDWEQLMLVAPTNIAFGGPDMKTLIIASLCGWSVHTAPMAVAGVPVRYPKI
ncbi:SMP-30/gluconolactonase/LRE family protein [Mesorhizobium sp. VNQ89]|uniref:SMP-30/gluconolactonase/LRE family protein n=1 Tax=Mesorhizobium quangtriensis TaxID=3157709 RepID=UPI0032B849C0